MRTVLTGTRVESDGSFRDISALEFLLAVDAIQLRSDFKNIKIYCLYLTTSQLRHFVINRVT